MPNKNKKIIKKVPLLILFFLVFVLAFFWISFGINPVDIVKYLGAQIGSTIGVSVSVPPNPFSQLVQQLKEKEEFLLEKEKTLEQKEAELEESNIFTKKNRYYLFLVLGGGILLILILIILNFYLDYRYRRKSKRNQ